MRDTIELAREAGFELGKAFVNGVLVDATTTELKAFEALVRADEREACAKVCDDRAFQFFSESPFFVEMHGLADAIRARGNT